MVTLSNILFYVKDLRETLDFFERAFGLKTAFIDESGVYAQMETGMTALSFVDLEFAKENMGKEVVEFDGSKLPFAFEIALSVDDVDEAYAIALKEGAVSVAKPTNKPWGQRDAYVRDPNGILIEICSPLMPCSNGSCGCSCE